MNTDGFDKHAKANLAFYEGFMNFSKIVIVAIAITLAAMAYFLLQRLPIGLLIRKKPASMLALFFVPEDNAGLIVRTSLQCRHY